MQLTIVLPFDHAAEETPIWAMEEACINFRRDHDRATRCTMAFAALELQTYLHRTVPGLVIDFASECPAAGEVIDLSATDPASTAESFTLRSDGRKITIASDGRIGVLYGAYELLRLQGWRWYSPEREGEVPPPPREAIIHPTEVITVAPSMTLGRGFDFEGLSKDSADLYIWMARNRLNLGGYRPATGALCGKLGIHMKNGGHIFEDILRPDRVLPSGKALWEEHQEWYGLPADGVRKKETALRIQFCVSQPDLMTFLAEELLQHVMSDWYESDRIDVWGFDTWGASCTCESCRKLGNSSDQNLLFFSALRAYLNEARADGRLDHDIRMVMACYEGTVTLTGPEHPCPQNLVAAGDCGTYYPINRCYAHPFADTKCSENHRYHDALKSWQRNAADFPIVVGEYYNVSKFEDLPLLFTRRICEDLPAYYAAGVRGMTYMHLPMLNWGMRALTQVLYAQFCWDIDSDSDTTIREYFAGYYGPYADAMRAVYERIEAAWRHIAQWRAWAGWSVLSALQQWDGAKPQQPLQLCDHFGSMMEVIACGQHATQLLHDALDDVNTVRVQAQEDDAHIQPVSTIDVARNPIEAHEKAQLNVYEHRISEDRRLLRYGAHAMQAMTAMVVYYDALYRDDTELAEETWEEIEELADTLDSYFIPLTYFTTKAGFYSRDALTRTQLRDVIRRCRKQRYARERLASGV